MHDARASASVPEPAVVPDSVPLHIGLLTGADDRPYAYGLARSLLDSNVRVDFIGSDDMDVPEMHADPRLVFLNLRGDQSADAPVAAKVRRLALYYLRLIAYALRARPRVFHILWNNKVEWFDRTVLMAWYRACGRRVVMTAHNVNVARRDGHDSALNRATLRIQYRLCDHVFVHTDRMKQELLADFDVPNDRVSVIPYGVYDTLARRGVAPEEARRRLGLGADLRVALFFGQIAPYKGLEYLVEAVPEIARHVPGFRLVVAGKVKSGSEEYWTRVARRLEAPEVAPHVVTSIRHVPDDELELYFEAADVMVLPYTAIFQSGVFFLAYTFGLPVVATDVGSLADHVVEGTTGHVCRPRDPADIARALRQYFGGAMYDDLRTTRRRIAAHAAHRYSWREVARITTRAYRSAAGAR